MVISPDGVVLFGPEELEVIYGALKNHRRCVAAQMGILPSDGSNARWERAIGEFGITCQLIQALRPYIRTPVREPFNGV